jgi:hypothetical protein
MREALSRTKRQNPWSLDVCLTSGRKSSGTCYCKGSVKAMSMRLTTTKLAFLFVALNLCWSSRAQVPTLVQRVAGTSTLNSRGHLNSGNATWYTLPLPSGSLPGNCLVFMFNASDNAGTVSMSDDKGTNTWTLQVSADDTTNGRMAQIWTAANATPGTRIPKVSFSSGKTYVSAVASEWANTSCVLDSASGSNGSSGIIQAGTLTLTVLNDLLLQYAVNDTDYTVNRWTAGSQPNINWQLLTADASIGNNVSPTNGTNQENAVASQWGIFNTVGTINPQITQAGGSTNGYVSAAVALRAANVGTLPSATTRSLGILHNGIMGGSSSPQAIQIPCYGNSLLVEWGAGSGDDLIGITDSNGNAYQETAAPVQTADGNLVDSYYSLNAKCSPGMTMTLSYNHNPLTDAYSGQGATLQVYDMVGLSAFDKSQTAQGNSTTGVPSITGVSITPSAANNFIVTQFVQDLNYEIAVNVGNWDSIIWGNQPYVNNDAPTWTDQASGFANYVAPNTNPVTFTWTMFSSSTAANQWINRADSFTAVSAPAPPTGLRAVVN